MLEAKELNDEDLEKVSGGQTVAFSDGEKDIEVGKYYRFTGPGTHAVIYIVNILDPAQYDGMPFFTVNICDENKNVLISNVRKTFTSVNYLQYASDLNQ